MRFFKYPSLSFVLAALLVAVTITHYVGAASIEVRGTELATREVSSSKATFEFVGTDLMAPHDVELVRRVDWTYTKSTCTGI